jgi:hypothetical protein
MSKIYFCNTVIRAGIDPDPYDFNLEEYTSREECIEAARKEAKERNSEAFYIGVKEDIDVKLSAHSVLDMMSESLYNDGIADNPDEIFELDWNSGKFWQEDFLQGMLDEVWQKYLAKIGGFRYYNIVEIEKFYVESEKI